MVDEIEIVSLDSLLSKLLPSDVISDRDVISGCDVISDRDVTEFRGGASGEEGQEYDMTKTRVQPVLPSTVKFNFSYVL